MSKIIVVTAAALLLAGCASSEERTLERFNRWADACGAPPGDTTVISDAEWAPIETCIYALEDGYQAERAARSSAGMAMMGLGASMMATPPAQARPLPRPCITTVSPQNRSAVTTCY